MPAYTIRLSLPTQPICPMCLEPLNGSTMDLTYSVVMCSKCVTALPPHMLTAVLASLSSPHRHRELSTVHGLRLWTPTDADRRTEAARTYGPILRHVTAE
jgi:hypothetical protein